MEKRKQLKLSVQQNLKQHLKHVFKARVESVRWDQFHSLNFTNLKLVTYFILNTNRQKSEVNSPVPDHHTLYGLHLCSLSALLSLTEEIKTQLNTRRQNTSDRAIKRDTTRQISDKVDRVKLCERAHSCAFTVPLKQTATTQKNLKSRSERAHVPSRTIHERARAHCCPQRTGGTLYDNNTWQHTSRTS